MFSAPPPCAPLRRGQSQVASAAGGEPVEGGLDPGNLRGAAMSERQLWERYKKYLCVCEPIGLTLDVSRMGFDDAFLTRLQGPLARAFEAMDALEKGAIANPDEKRRVGH